VTSPENISDAELRRMRDFIYEAQCLGQIQTDESWNAVKSNWQRDVEWLEVEYNKEMKKL
jgi:hypothetical protein